MTITLPSIVPVGYAGDTTDFLKTKEDRSGASRIITGSVAIPSGTVSGTVIGLFPFNKGMKLHGFVLSTDDLDSGTSVTFDAGYQYYDSATGSSLTNSIVSASAVPQTGGLVPRNATTAVTWTALGDGWIVVKTGGATTTTTGNVQFNCSIAYDASGVTN